MAGYGRIRNLLDLRRELVLSTGHFELVTDAVGGTFTDNGANRVINNAQHWLDRLMLQKSSAYRYFVNVASGQYYVPFQHCRLVKNVWLVDSEGTKTRLTFKAINDLREEYSGDWTTLDTGGTQYWAMADVLGSYLGNFGSELHTDTGFADQTKWTASATLTYNLAGTKYVSSTGNQRISLGQPRTAWNASSVATAGTKVLCTVNAKITTGYLALSYGPEMQFWFEPYSDDVSRTYQTELIIGPLDSAVTVPLQIISDNFTGEIYDFSIKAITDYTYWNGHHDTIAKANQFKSVVILPPPDADSTIIIEGDFNSQFLSGDNDASWWIDNEPDVLLLAARRELELQYRNKDGADHYTVECQNEVTRIWHSFISQSMQGTADQHVIEG